MASAGLKALFHCHYLLAIRRHSNRFPISFSYNVKTLLALGRPYGGAANAKLLSNNSAINNTHQSNVSVPLLIT